MKQCENIVYIIIVNYNGSADTIECIESIRNITYSNYHIVIVDNASTDNSVVRLRSYEGMKITLIESEKNVGFSGANNIGMRYAIKNKAKYILLLNNDTIVTHTFLEPLVEELRNDSKKMVTSKILYAYDRNKIWYAGGTYNSYIGRTVHIGINQRDSKQYDNSRKVSFISGCCMLFCADAVCEIGEMDEKYFLYCEDLDYCCRFMKAGYGLRYVPDSIIYHKVSASTGSASDLWTYYTIRNHFFIIDEYVKKGFKFWAVIFIYFLILRNVMRKTYSFRVVKKAIADYKNGTTGKV